VNTAGVLTYMNTLEWEHMKDWRGREKKIWKDLSGNNLGWYKNYRNLIFVMVRDAGHLLPSDQPRAAWLMLGKYFLNDWGY
jgi:serine carboxypeptidase-like clade IV